MDITEYKAFAELVKALRRHHQLSQRALAHALSISPGYIGQWECALSKPSKELTLRFCEYFAIQNQDYVFKLAYACGAPRWVQDSVQRAASVEELHRQLQQNTSCLSDAEHRALALLKELPPAAQDALVDQLEAWVSGFAAAQKSGAASSE